MGMFYNILLTFTWERTVHRYFLTCLCGHLFEGPSKITNRNIMYILTCFCYHMRQGLFDDIIQDDIEKYQTFLIYKIMEVFCNILLAFKWEGTVHRYFLTCFSGHMMQRLSEGPSKITIRNIIILLLVLFMFRFYIMFCYLTTLVSMTIVSLQV